MHIHLNYTIYELIEFGIFIFLSIIIMINFIHDVIVTPNIFNSQTHSAPWKNIPELTLLSIALPLHLLWEVAQFPLYTLWHDGNWNDILFALVHCTLGDLLIMLSVYWLISLVNHSRNWIRSPTITDVTLFTILGLLYTIYSETVNTRTLKSWEYTELMPLIPYFDIGATPFFQWLLIPPVLILFIHLIYSSQRDE